MTKPLIAIVGSYQGEREKELELAKRDGFRKAGEELGRELARQNFRILVYDGGENFLDGAVVRGYVREQEAGDCSIRVQFPTPGNRPSFGEDKGNEAKFDYQPYPNGEWEYSFFQSFGLIQGMLIVGGGNTALISGLVMIAHEKPLAACAAFGGSGEKIWRVQRTQSYPLSDVEMNAMGMNEWTPGSAKRLVAMLNTQIAGFEQRGIDRKNQILNKELKDNKTINLHAKVSAGLFLISASAWPLSTAIEHTNSCQALCLALATSMVAGTSGATMRVVLDWAIGVTRTFRVSDQSVFLLGRYLALGVVAGGLAGVSFVLAQVFASDFKPADMADPLRKLVPFLVVIGFTAGLAAEVVLSNLRKSTPAIEVPAAKPKA